MGDKSSGRSSEKSFGNKQLKDKELKKTEYTNVFGEHSDPAQLITDQMTQVYQLPDKMYQNKDQLLDALGFKLKRVLGQGSYAKVYKCTSLNNNQTIACKVIDIINDKYKAKRMIHAKSELFVLEKVNHPAIVKLFDHFIINNQIFIFMQLAVNGSLTELVKEDGPLPEKVCRFTFAQIISGVKHMHAKGIAHRDLKCDNILLDKNYNALISDFGLSRVAYRVSKGGIINLNSYCGTEPYMAPEILEFKKSYNPFPTDIWALGVILFVMYNKAYPFDVTNKQKAFSSMRTGNWFYSRKVKPPTPEMDQILNSTLTVDPDLRVKIDQLQKDKWFKNEVHYLKKLKYT